jgi:hypothetical protein
MAIFGKNVSIDRDLQGLRTAPIQSAPLGQSQFVKAPIHRAGGNAGQLAKALSRFSNSLAAYGQVRGQTDKETALEVQENLDTLAGQSTEQLNSFLKTADYANFGPKSQAAAKTLIGSKRASDFNLEMAAIFEADDYNVLKGNPVQEYEAKRQEQIAAFKAEGNNRSATAFERATEKQFRMFGADVLQKHQAEAERQRDLVMFGHIQGRANDAIKEAERTGQPYDPGEIAKWAIDEVESGRGSAGMDREQQAAAVYRQAEQFAAIGRMGIAESLVSQNRGAAGPLRKTLKYGLKSEELLAAGDRKAQAGHLMANIRGVADLKDLAKRGEMPDEVLKQWETEHGELSPSVQESLFTMQDTAIRNREASLLKAQQKRDIDNRIAADEKESFQKAIGLSSEPGAFARGLTGRTTINKDGSQKHINGEQERKENVETLERQLRIGTEDGSIAPAEKRGIQLKFIENTGEVLDDLKQALTAGHVASTPINLQGDVPVAAGEGLALYMEMYQSDIGGALRHLSDNPRARQFYEAARIFRETGMPTRDALTQAFEVQQNTDPDAKYLQYDDVATLAADIGNSAAVDVSNWRDPTPENMGQIARSSKDMVNLYMRTGMGKEKAIALVVEHTGKTHAMIGKTLVNVSHPSLGQDFPDLAEKKIQHYFDSHAEEFQVEDVDDLTIMPHGNSPSAFVIFNTKTGAPVEDTADRNITPRGLGPFRQQLLDEADKLLLEENQRAIERRKAYEARSFEADTQSP